MNPTTDNEQSMNHDYELSTDSNHDHRQNQSKSLTPRICQKGKSVSNETSVIKSSNCIETCVDVICIETESGPSTANQQKSKKSKSSKKDPTKKDLSDSIINLSSRILTKHESDVLEKGLKFCPTQSSVDLSEVRKDLDIFHNRLRTKQYWSTGKGKKYLNAQKKLEKEKKKQQLKDRDNLVQPLITDCFNGPKPAPPFNKPSLIKAGKGSKSNWTPPSTCIPLENWIQENIKDLNKAGQPKPIRDHNLSTKQRKALRDLAKDKSITIKPADKGGAIVLMDTIDYILEADRQLSEEGTYQKLESDPTPLFQAKVKERVQTMLENKEITKKVAKTLLSQKPRTPQIYFLPKIHKNVDPPPAGPSVRQMAARQKESHQW